MKNKKPNVKETKRKERHSHNRKYPSLPYGTRSRTHLFRFFFCVVVVVALFGCLQTTITKSCGSNQFSPPARLTSSPRRPSTATFIAFPTEKKNCKNNSADRCVLQTNLLFNFVHCLAFTSVYEWNACKQKILLYVFVVCI